ncbi:MAG: endonuclease [Lautropia sp.]|nr:MAG: endonuclease [Pseudomonadota bacterium]MBC6959039.1 endonuclease [Lautropia sp.]MDL1906301.1 endonuclease [Betaproteobacteria bacterium PRO1]RIK90262.1 MAG: endonuclease [Burkholderiales bacterium]
MNTAAQRRRPAEQPEAPRVSRRRNAKPRRGTLPPKSKPGSAVLATLRVSTYNIHKGVLREFIGLRRVTRIHELRTRLHELDSDLVFLQEVQGRHERHARRLEHWPDEPQDVFLSRSPRLRQTFETAYGRNASYLHGHHGNALLSRYPIVDLENRDISDHALEKRGVLHCVVKVGRVDVHCFVVHFGLLARSRERQLGALIEWVSNAVSGDAPLIIAGDFNDWRNRLSDRLCREIGVVEVFDAVKPKLDFVRRAAYFARDRYPAIELPEAAAGAPRMVRTARTFPALVPWFRMDRIYQRGFRVSAARVLRGIEWARLSDHSPLVADLELVDPGA